MATSTAASPTKLCSRATSCGIAVILILSASTTPMTAPIPTANQMSPNEEISPLAKVAATAIAIPEIAAWFPLLAVAGEVSPLRPKMNRTPETR